MLESVQNIVFVNAALIKGLFDIFKLKHFYSPPLYSFADSFHRLK